MIIALVGFSVFVCFKKDQVEVMPVLNTNIKDVGNSVEHSDLIRVGAPKANDVIKSPLIISGEARGTWYFEASFPVKLIDANGNVVASVPAQAQGEWMTENFVPFKAELKFNIPSTDYGTLILEKDNPSGLPENNDEIIIPIRFK